MNPLFRIMGAAALLASVGAAQTNLVPRLIGYASDQSAAISSLILSQATCRPADRLCPTGVGPATGYAGGAAYNAINGSLWHTQGTRMAEIRIRDCSLLCSAPANLVLGAGSVATGLDVSEADYRLYQLESIPGAAALSIRHIRSCPPQVISTCRIQLPSNTHVAGAVAVDDRNGLIFYAASRFAVAAPANVVLVARVGDPCNIRCRFTVDACGTNRLGPITGMGYDECRQLLVVTDGRQTVFMSSRPSFDPCTYRAVGCCAASPGVGNFRWHGIDVEPAHPESVGSSCLSRICRPCSNMRMVASGDPVVGNGAFNLRVVDAQAGALLLIGVAAGPCQVPGVPLFCGRWHTNLAVTAWLGPFNIGGTGCQGEVLFPFGLPPDYALCGARICSQGAVVCPGPALGVALTNAVDFVIGS